MALPGQLHHRSIRNPAIPYNSYASPTSADPAWVAGSNILTSQRKYAELRPGYDAFEATPTTFTDTLTRLFLWHKWDDTFYAMLSTFASSAQHVYYYQQGDSSSFTDLSISNNSSVSAAYPVDFVTSDNTLFMSSGDSAISHKWDGTTVSKWGIAISEGTATNNTAGSGANAGGTGGTWTNPSNVTSTVNFATATANVHSSSQYVNCETFGFALSTGASIGGIQVSLEAESTYAVDYLTVVMLKAGSQIGSSKLITMGVLASPTTFTLGSSSDLWDTTWLANDINQTTFGVAIQASSASPGSPSATISVRNVEITVYTTGGPAPTVSASAGTMSASYGYQYVYCYGNSNTGHISSPTPPGNNTGAFSLKASVAVPVVASTDAQVNQIRVFRTTDGGGGIYFELPNSPFANSTTSITDTATDAELSSVVAPIPNFNDPPPSRLQGMVWFQNRIWGFLASSSFVYFSGWEEINIGVEEECFPSGTLGNSAAVDDCVRALASTSDYLFIFTPVSISKIEGDSLDTFKKSFLVKNMGCRSRTNVAVMGRSVAWLNVDSTIWTTDGTSLTEIGQPIRNDIGTIDQTQTTLVFYNYGVNHWLILNDGANSKQYVFDLDTEQWMPPWNLAVTVQAASVSGTVSTSGETTLGVQQELIATAAKVLKRNTSVFTDNGTKYSAFGKTNLFDLVPGGFEIYTGGYGIGAPAGRIGELEFISVETNTIAPDDVRVLTDDDPYLGVFSSAPTGPQAPTAPLRTQGANLIEKWWYFRYPTGRRAAVDFEYSATGNHFKLYGFDLAFMPLQQEGQR